MIYAYLNTAWTGDFQRDSDDVCNNMQQLDRNAYLEHSEQNQARPTGNQSQKKKAIAEEFEQIKEWEKIILESSSSIEVEADILATTVEETYASSSAVFRPTVCTKLLKKSWEKFISIAEQSDM